MMHTTKGIVLKTVKYGETSLICTVFTELLGMQSYIVKGVRSAKAKGRKANILFAGSVLDLIVYEQANKNLQNIKEYQPHLIYQSIQEDVVKNGVVLFAMEVIKQLLATHDPQPELFEFLLEFLIQLDKDATTSIANYPLYFIIQSAKFAGYYLSGEYNDAHPFADIHEGRFSAHSSAYPPFITGSNAHLMSELNQASSLDAIQQIKMTAEERRNMMQYFLTFLQLHVPHFKELRTITVLTAIFY